MVEIFNLFKPSILLIQTHYYFNRVKGVIAHAVERIAQEGFYKSVEIPSIYEKADRKRIRKIVRKNELMLTMWVSLEIYQENLNLAAIDENERKQNVLKLKNLMNFADECGAVGLGVISGRDPGPSQRATAIESLYTSLCELCECAKSSGPLRIAFEPLDRGAHKNGVVGPTNDFVPLINKIKKSYSNIGLVWDSAHVALCGDDIFNSLKQSKEITYIIHLANAVLDRSDKMFGDYHMKIGEPGFLTVEVIAKILKTAIETDFFEGNYPCVSIEVQAAKEENPWDTVLYCRNILRKAATMI